MTYVFVCQREAAEARRSQPAATSRAMVRSIVRVARAHSAASRGIPIAASPLRLSACVAIIMSTSLSVDVNRTASRIALTVAKKPIAVTVAGELGAVEGGLVLEVMGRGR
jgi:hypothetical protein